MTAQPPTTRAARRARTIDLFWRTAVKLGAEGIRRTAAYHPERLALLAELSHTPAVEREALYRQNAAEFDLEFVTRIAEDALRLAEGDRLGADVLRKRMTGIVARLRARAEARALEPHPRANHAA